MNESVSIRRYQEGDEVRIAGLLHANFPHALGSISIQKTWSWQFGNDFTPTPSVVIAEAGSEIVAQYAAMRFPMTYRGNIVEGAVSTATVTDVDHRGKGLFTQLAKKLYEDMRNDGCQIIFGFPNAQSIHGFIARLGWFEVAGFPLHLKIINPYPVIRRYFGDNSLSKGIARVYAGIMKLVFPAGKYQKNEHRVNAVSPDALPEGINNVWKESFPSRNISIVRDAKYLDWRYSKKPFYKYEFYTVLDADGLCGYFVIYISDKFGFKTVYLMECAATHDSEDIYCSILNKLEEIALQKQSDAISVLLLSNHPNYKLFRKRGFLRVPKKFFPQDIYFGAKVLSDRVGPEYIRDPGNWYISWGDLDVV